MCSSDLLMAKARARACSAEPEDVPKRDAAAEHEEGPKAKKAHVDLAVDTCSQQQQQPSDVRIGPSSSTPSDIKHDTKDDKTPQDQKKAVEKTSLLHQALRRDLQESSEADASHKKRRVENQVPGG